jgi:hypothetical protein
MMRRWIGTGMITVLAVTAFPGGTSFHALRAQSSEPGNGEPIPLGTMTDERAARAPFGPGEELSYKVKLGVLDVGEGHMRVEGIEEVRGHPTYHVQMGLDASMGFGLAKVNDRYDSWLDTRMLVSRRFVRDINEPGYSSKRIFDIYPEEKRWERADADKSGQSLSPLVLDEISFLYFLRTLRLEVGQEYTFDRYFKEEGNPVKVRVLRRQRIEVPAGTFDAIVVQPIIQTDGLFSEGGEAEVYFTDDDQRHLVYLRSKVPLVGSITLHLQSVKNGTPLNPASR